MRLLFATTFGHLPDLVGGLQTSTDELASGLMRRGIEVAVLCATVRAAAASPSSRLPVCRTFRVADPVEALPAVAAGFQASAIVVQTGPKVIELLVAALETGRPTALYLHNVEHGELGGILLPDPSLRYIANSPFSAARWRAAFGVESAVVLPYVDPALYETATSREHALFVNPTVHKGVELFFGLAAARPGVRFAVVESWTLDPMWRRFCQERAARLGNIEWLAATDDMRALYARTRVLLMPSLWEEAYGRSVQEAQLSGIPVLASSRGNLVDTVGAGGLAVDLHAPIETWATALDTLWADDAGRYAAAARAHARRAEADPERILDRFIDEIARHVAARGAQSGGNRP